MSSLIYHGWRDRSGGAFPAATMPCNGSRGGTFMPVVGIVLAGAMLAEPLQMRQAVALVLTICGIALPVRFKDRPWS